MEQEIVSWEKQYCWISYRPPLYREKKLNFGTAEESLFGFLWSFIWYWDCWLRGWCLSIIILVINSPRIKGDNTVHAEVGKLRPWTISLFLFCFVLFCFMALELWFYIFGLDVACWPTKSKIFTIWPFKNLLTTLYWIYTAICIG